MEKKKKTEETLVETGISEEGEEEMETIDLDDALHRLGYQLVCIDGKIGWMPLDQLRDIS